MAFPAPRPTHPLVLGLVSLSLVLAGCSGGGGGSNAAGTTTAPTAAGGGIITASGAPGPDEGRLQTIVLAAADMPAGWAGRPSASTPTLEAAARLAMAQCLGRRNIDVDLVAGVVSQDFAKGAETIMSSARSYLSDDDVTTDTASYTNPKISTCLQQMLSAPGATPGGAGQNLVVKVTPGSGGGPSNVVATASVSTAAKTVTTVPTKNTTRNTTKTTTPKSTTTVKPVGLTATIVFITGPRLTVEIDFFGVGEEVPKSVRDALIAKVAARAAKG